MLHSIGVFLDLDPGHRRTSPCTCSRALWVMNLFGEVFGNASRSIIASGDSSRSTCPASVYHAPTFLVALIHFVPQLIILLVACLIADGPDPERFLRRWWWARPWWRPSPGTVG
ncbi:hypothetical protein QJS66_22860 [Kocuria rhizophila]|nr:hypothetical protein QJS66_22860 [Kocuria rhizophila]